MAKTVAKMMNAQPIGGKKGDKCVLLSSLRLFRAKEAHRAVWAMADQIRRWRDDVWTMKYLSGFKWEMLGEQVGTSCPPPVSGTWAMAKV